MAELSKSFPDGISYEIPYDTTLFVNVSINEVIHTFFEAVLLVIVVVYLFLQNMRATLIPILAVPVSIIGAFAGMYLLGFSINLLTLFGLILAIGIVVDDAIIVLENVERLMSEEKLALILGTEGDGLAASTIADCDYTVKIPMAHGVDSLNVAAASAVAFWQLGNRT